MVEHKVGEKRALMGHVIRGANHKTAMDIHQEIRSIQSSHCHRTGAHLVPTAMLLPWPQSRLVKALLVCSAPKPGDERPWGTASLQSACLARPERLGNGELSSYSLGLLVEA
jgi:hypothetical protein